MHSAAVVEEAAVQLTPQARAADPAWAVVESVTAGAAHAPVEAGADAAVVEEVAVAEEEDAGDETNQ